jgi:hypothetical protein
MPEPTKVGLSALMDARRKRAPLRLADLSTNIEESASQQAINKLLESNLTKAGFDLDKFGALLKQSDAEARQRMANFIAESDKRSAAALDTMLRTVQDWRNRVEHLKTLARPDGPFDNVVILDTATEIVVKDIEGSYSNRGLIHPISTHAGPNPENNWAQFLVDATQGEQWLGAGLVAASFGFLWQNPSDRYAVVSVLSAIVLNGSFRVLSAGGVFHGYRFSHLDISTGLDMHELWNDPPTSPLLQPGQSKTALDLGCDSSGAFSFAASDGEDLNRGFALTYEQFVMPPKGRVMFEVFCDTRYQIYDGEAQAVFRDEGRQVICPGLWISVLT